jgi:glycosyltransferase involved in cell wall biosynthesis|tara:strand:- start:9 stop:983 length:975 start_codon:yes stop_codon:yes gene_type:complete
MNLKPEITIVTSAYNRSEYLKVLLNSLKNQTFKNFEWVLGNDGSIDDTDEFIKKEKMNLDFKITYIKSSHRIGKAKMDNILFDHIKGNYTCYIGSDDHFTNHALEYLLRLIKKTNKHKDKNFAGVIAAAKNNKGENQTFYLDSLPKNELIMTYKEMRNFIKGDDTVLEHSKNYKNKKFLEVDFVINESSLLSKIHKDKYFLISPEIVKIMVRAKNSVSYGKKMSYCRGSAYCIAEEQKMNDFNEFTIIRKMRLIINYWRYCFHGDINFLKAKKMWEVTNNKWYFILIYPIAFLICLRDMLLNKVEKTHIEFEKNITKAKITIDF